MYIRQQGAKFALVPAFLLPAGLLSILLLRAWKINCGCLKAVLTRLMGSRCSRLPCLQLHVDVRQLAALSGVYEVDKSHMGLVRL